MARKSKDPNALSAASGSPRTVFTSDGAEEDDYVGERDPATFRPIPALTERLTPVVETFSSNPVAAPAATHTVSQDRSGPQSIMEKVAIMNGLREAAINPVVKKAIIDATPVGETVYNIFLSAVEKELEKMFGADTTMVENTLIQKVQQLNTQVTKLDQATQVLLSLSQDLKHQELVDILKLLTQRIGTK